MRLGSVPVSSPRMTKLPGIMRGPRRRRLLADTLTILTTTVCVAPVRAFAPASPLAWTPQLPSSSIIYAAGSGSASFNCYCNTRPHDAVGCERNDLVERYRCGGYRTRTSSLQFAPSSLRGYSFPIIAGEGRACNGVRNGMRWHDRCCGPPDITGFGARRARRAGSGASLMAGPSPLAVRSGEQQCRGMKRSLPASITTEGVARTSATEQMLRRDSEVLHNTLSYRSPSKSLWLLRSWRHDPDNAV